MHRHKENWKLDEELERQELIGVHGHGAERGWTLKPVVEFVVALVPGGDVHSLVGVIRGRLVVDIVDGDGGEEVDPPIVGDVVVEFGVATILNVRHQKSCRTQEMGRVRYKEKLVVWDKEEDG